ncbi:MAG TPA: methyltransferase domain-containing protein, partial [Gammaproteobacteria bacterium]|nr:methyltransferase domain-containing protein [Gammaproteobacteria bacterium]
MARGRKRLPAGPREARIESLSHDGRGVARIAGKVTFIDGALPGELVTFRYTGRRRSRDEGSVLEILQAAPERVAPRCDSFGRCGGCSLQHLDPAAQIEAKQRLLLEQLRRIGAVEAQRLLPPLTGPLWGYRHKARLGARFVKGKGRVLVGFRERHSGYIVDMQRCEILHPAIGGRMTELAELVQSLRICRSVPQLEVAVGDGVAALVFRHLEELDPGDRALLEDFGRRTGLHIYLQPGGPDSVHLLWPERSQLGYRLPEFDLELLFLPTDFTQVNEALNRKMVRQALELLDCGPRQRVLDLFCGIGNFSLPLARMAGEVVGVEGDAALVQRARDNARRNGLHNVEFHVADLAQEIDCYSWA